MLRGLAAHLVLGHVVPPAFVAHSALLDSVVQPVILGHVELRGHVVLPDSVEQ